jgi:hypothetical protein
MQPTLPLVPPLSCAYSTCINTLPNPATDILHPRAYEDGTDKEFRNVGYQEPDAGESPKKEQFTYQTHLQNADHIKQKLLLPAPLTRNYC